MTLRILLESRTNLGLDAGRESLTSFLDISDKIQRFWKDSALASMKDDAGVAAESQALTKQIWTILKTLLFSTIMIADSLLSAVIYIPQSIYAESPLTPSSLSLLTLHTLSNLCFVVSQFGGLTTGSTATNQGFSELKKTFYLAIDLLADANDGRGEGFVRDACREAGKVVCMDLSSSF
jgi:hypothetical protein